MDDDLPSGMFLQLALYDPHRSDEELLQAMAAALVQRGARVAPYRFAGEGITELEVRNGTGIIGDRPEILCPGRNTMEGPYVEDGIVELLTECDDLQPVMGEDPDPVLAARAGQLARGCFLYLVEAVRPAMAAILVEHPPDDLARLDTTTDSWLLATAGWVDDARLDR